MIQWLFGMMLVLLYCFLLTAGGSFSPLTHPADATFVLFHFIFKYTVTPATGNAHNRVIYRLGVRNQV